MYTKSYFGTPTEENLIQRILENCDFALAGIGEWAWTPSPGRPARDHRGHRGRDERRPGRTLGEAGADTVYFHLYDVMDLDHVGLLGC